MFEITIVAAFIAVLVIISIFLGVKTVEQGFHYTVERFGRYRATLKPGLSFIIPIFDSIGSRVNVMEQVLDVPAQSVITRDNAKVMINGLVFYQVIDARAATYEITNLPRAILNLCMTNLRSVCGSMELDETLSNRDKIATELLSVIEEAARPWGVKVLRVEIQDIEPPEELVNAMSLQMIAERKKRAEVTEAEGIRAAEILRAEGSKSAAILIAEGEKQSAILEAEARERTALAEAKATQMVSKAVAEGDVKALNYFVAQQYITAFGKLAESDNQKTVFMPMETSSLIGSVGGIQDLIKEIQSPSS